jgi:hypothetical protein
MEREKKWIGIESLREAKEQRWGTRVHKASLSPTQIKIYDSFLILPSYY